MHLLLGENILLHAHTRFDDYDSPLQPATPSLTSCLRSTVAESTPQCMGTDTVPEKFRSASQFKLRSASAQRLRAFHRMHDSLSSHNLSDFFYEALFHKGAALRDMRAQLSILSHLTVVYDRRSHVSTVNVRLPSHFASRSACNGSEEMLRNARMATTQICIWERAGGCALFAAGGAPRVHSVPFEGQRAWRGEGKSRSNASLKDALHVPVAALSRLIRHDSSDVDGDERQRRIPRKV